MLLILAAGLAGLAALDRGGGGGGANAEEFVVRTDEWFYGQSPPVYPSPNMTGVAEWAVSFAKARDMVGQMTLEEKVSLTGGVDHQTGCSGIIPAVERLDFPGLCLSDAGQGLRATDFVNSYPSGIHVAASWNKDLAYQRANSMGQEFKIKGVNVLLGPVVGPAGRVVRGGRNWEGFSVDPYLNGELVFGTVRGVQDAGVITSTKHFIANEQETNRMPRSAAAVSSNIDDRTMHEIYLWPFQDAVKAGTGNIMCSYQRLNNSYGCQNSKALNGLLKTELGYQGFVVSDWGAQHSGVGAALAGMDVTMPRGSDFWGGALIEAVRNGSVPEERVDDMAMRTIAAWYQMRQDEDFPEPGIGMPRDLTQPHAVVDARLASSRPIILQSAIEGHVLVKNNRSALPISSSSPPRLVSMFGYSATSPRHLNPAHGGTGDPWAFGSYPISPEELTEGFSGTGASWGETSWSDIGRNGTLISGGGSGATSPSCAVSPFEALKMRAFQDGSGVLWDFENARPEVDPASDVCLVFGNAWASEGYDRPGLSDGFTDAMILHVAARCNNTVVVLHNAGTRLVDAFVEHENVTAFVFAHLPGQASGPALAAILYGEANPSGKLPYTVAREASDYGAMLDPDAPEGMFELFPQSNFTEGVLVDYRYFDEEGVEPRFEFGFGLSYTSFEYGNLSVEVLPDTRMGEEFPSGAVISGGQADLWDVFVRVSARITNTGERDGQEAAQLYLALPGAGQPKKVLRGFEKVAVPAGEARDVAFELRRRDLSVWDTRRQKWRLPGGRYEVLVGRSSRSLDLEGSFTVR